MITFTRSWRGYAAGTSVSTLADTIEALAVAEGAATYGGVSYPLNSFLDADNRVQAQVDAAGNGFASVKSTGVDDPTNLPSAAAGSAGALTGSYYYAFTYVLADGSETAPSTGTGTVVSPSAKQVNVSGILVGPDDSVVARKLYRTTGTPVDPKDYYYLATISDNTTTTYVDNAADGTLGAPVSWLSTVKGSMSIGGARVANFLNQSTVLGQGTGAGYACTAIGYNALNVVTTGRRNVAIGTYALTATTTGYQNTAIGVHAGGGLTAGLGNTVIGYGAGSATKPMNNFNTLLGQEVGAGAGGANCGTGLVGVGYRALYGVNTADQCVGIGYFAGAYANASRQLFIDNSDRTNIANAQNVGLIYGKGETTAVAQVLNLNALVRVGPPSLTVSSLPAATGLAGYRAFVTDANATTFASVVAGGGANGVPVYCDGTNWRIG